MKDKAQRSALPAVGELVRDKSNGRLYRVVLAGGGAPDVALCHVFGSRLEIKHISVEEFQRRAAHGYQNEDQFVYVEDDPFDAYKRVIGRTKGHESKSVENWNRIEGLVEDRNLFRKLLYGGTTRKLIFEQHANGQGVSIQLIRRLHRFYLQRGMTPLSVASNFWRCGRMEQPARFRDSDDVNEKIKKRVFKSRPGRRSSDDGHYAIPSELLDRLFQQYVDIYLTSKEGPWQISIPNTLAKRIKLKIPDARFPARRIPLKEKQRGREKCRDTGQWPHAPPMRDGPRRRQTMQRLVDHLNYVCRCTREVRDLTGQVIALELAPFEEVTVRQFQHYWLTRVPVAVRKRRAMGERKYALTGRPKHGHALQHSAGPGTEYMIDATVADVFLVSRYDRTVVVGRPTVYLVMDVWSRMIAGVLVTLDPPSFAAVALVFENIVTPKDEFCARYDLQIDPEQWPCHDLPGNGMSADRGSDYMKIDAWKRVNQQLHLPISNVEARNPVMHALIERRFGTIPVHFQRESFGVVEKDATTRGSPHYAWDATDTLSEFTKKLLRAILVYIQTPIGREGAEPDMIFQGMADTPLNRWNWGMENRTGSLRHHSLDEVRIATWPRSTALPTERGLLWQGVYYTSPYIESTLIHCWGRKAREPVPIQFNPGDISRILLEGKGHLEYGYQAGTNKQLPGDVDLMEWNIRSLIDRANSRRERRKLQPQRVMEILNNVEESRKSKREQKMALKRAGLSHPETVGMREARERERNANRKSKRPLLMKNKHDSSRAEGQTESEIEARLHRNMLDLLGD
ncbi:TPA: hypothetical protein ACK3Q6_004970 [Burkholderia cepacia]|uniref:hypothetical protein n=1 Tax=Burkholderia cepacia TaxID=292 RepID=UPI001CF184C1|nr:hypothetical protein [Burkholderia cepacia]MCA8357643.1 hypothetical protein [Burkholderia cepacia]HDV6370439.1 hypothetical protein [Burkholderia cepacia]